MEEKRNQIKAQPYTFRGQRSDESVLLVIRQHTWQLLPIVIVWFVLLAILVLCLKYFGASIITSLVIGLVLVIGLWNTFYRYYIWNNGTYVITDQRVIKIDQINLFSRVISEAELNRIQEISTQIKGPIKTMLNFGTVSIQTASTTTTLNLEDTPHPYEVQQIIVGLKKRLDEA